MSKFSVLILAGGKSSRMGQDKACLQFAGQSLLQHMQQLATQAGASQVLISRNQKGYIQDLQPEQGPLAGILAALPHCQHKRLLVLPIDTPLLSTQALQLLLQQSAAAACFNQSPLPCLLTINSQLQHVISQQLTKQQRSIKQLLNALNASSVDIDETQLLNTNTPADWQAFLQQQTTLSCSLQTAQKQSKSSN
ncbi:molybdenum cofactor guanylyltransferase [Rheinheimera sp. MMS21-TC3]|uniref:molybdenum cofactor guanylyltransferase n=1 Tax=Rheinheimera sp. MMS21-TC3 TaxID=3072790 RepID=UPI0028C4A979|nr:molybdenum cofactor guanylyltransferase [Rheinheimera sp. MMS21-TC3]WNO60610.1 molybdenum cofactor guanylyltransferase [Rheinheimera sp. MMS21-TC3]